MKNWKDNIYFILVEPKESGNIGATARAIKNMGFRNLCLVKPPDVISDEARWFARNAENVLESAEIFPAVHDAISDKSLVIGTTRRKGRKRRSIMTPEQGAGRIFEMARRNKIAILFGREDRGLYNNEIEECGFLVTIPASKKQPSLNLSHAVLIVAYELSKAEYAEQGKHPEKTGTSDSVTIPSPLPDLVSHGELSALYARISDILHLIGYIQRGNRDLETRIMQNLKHLVGRSGLAEWELHMLYGICSQIEKSLE